MENSISKELNVDSYSSDYSWLLFHEQLDPIIALLQSYGLPDLILTLSGLICAGICALLIYLDWKLFHQPFDLFRDFTELGFEEVTKKCGSDLARRNAINESRRRRKIGNLPPSYPNGWFAILETRKLDAGSVQEVHALGLNLVAWRGKSGTAYVSDAYCPHLGAHLGIGGEVHGECIQCPFHNWSFDGEQQGKLACIPYADKMPNFVKLNMWTTTETNGFIFLWYHVNHEKPTWYPDKIPEINEGRWAYRGRSEMIVACHIQEIPENGADVAHLNVLHSSSVLCGDNPKRSLFSWNFIKHVWFATWEANTEPDRVHEGLMKVVHYLKLFDRFPFFYVNVDIHQTGPGIVALHFDSFLGKGVFIQTVTPIEPLLQCVTHHFYTSSTLIHPLAKVILDSESKQIARDIRIWNRKCFLDKPLLTKEDQSIKSFRRWFSQFYSENSPKHYAPSSDDNANPFTF